VAPSRPMSNVLDQQYQQQIVALGRLGWSLRRIEEVTGVRRETISGYLKAARVPVRGRGGRPRVWPPPNPATTPEVSTDPLGKPAISDEVFTRSDGPNPATAPEVSTDLPIVPHPGRAPSASACEPCRELIERALDRGRNAVAIWQDLVDGHGFASGCASVRRFVHPDQGQRPRRNARHRSGVQDRVRRADGPRRSKARIRGDGYESTPGAAERRRDKRP